MRETPALVTPPPASDPVDSVAERRAEELAERLQKEVGQLNPSSAIRELVAVHLTDEPALQLDDLSGIPLLGGGTDVRYLEQRARLRAREGDLLASCYPFDPVFADYAEHQLGLGHVEWLVPTASPPTGLASACWTDREVRRTLVRALREDRLRYLHPHMGIGAVWILGQLLKRTSRRPLSVIAPPPFLTGRVNDKIWFNQVVARLFDPGFVIPGAPAWNLSTLVVMVERAALRHRRVVIKAPDSAGGSGNIILPLAPLRGIRRERIRQIVRQAIAPLHWHREVPLLVSVWETDVLAAPSTQVWIPPETDGLPIVEGVFQQSVDPARGTWTGSATASLPVELQDEMIAKSWTLARLFQRLSYVGRCSFDLLVTGTDLARGGLSFVECNGRWGGTSAPMTIVRRLFPPPTTPPFATRRLEIEGIGRLSFTALLDAFADDLYDARTGRGHLVFFNPGGLQARQCLDVLAMASDAARAHAVVDEEIPMRVQELIFQSRD